MSAPRLAVITLCAEGAQVARALAEALRVADLYLHRQLRPAWGGTKLPPALRKRTRFFPAIIPLTATLFDRYRGLIYIAPCGAVVRALAPRVRHKTTDPGVVVLDVGARYAVSLLGGHEGGANALALRVANLLGAEPVISTTSEALKTLTVGVGCRRGTSAARIVAAVRVALRRAKAKLEQVAALASADIKRDEAGLLAAAAQLGLPLRLIASDELRRCPKAFTRSKLAQRKVNLPAVAEPAALLAGRRTSLLLPRQIIGGVTVAVARENCMWSA